MKRTRKSVKVKLLTLLVGCFLGGYGKFSAAAVDTNLVININGSIEIPPCKINGGNTELLVSFEKLSPTEVDGQQNAVTKTVGIDCSFYQGAPYIRIDGDIFPGAGQNILNTTGANASSLGIALYQGNDVNGAYPLLIGAGEQGKYGYKINRGLTGENTSHGQFSFTAVPVKPGSGTLKAGAFSATATMSIIYL